MQTVKDGNIYKAVKQVERQYWKREETEQSWTQPVLSANGIIGGDSFAVLGSAESTAYYHPTFHAFDNNASTYWEPVDFRNPSGQYVIIYNPNRLNVTNIAVKNRSGNNCSVTAGIIYASNDNENWTELTTFTGNTASGAQWNITLSANADYYKYYKFYISSGQYNTSNTSCSMAEIKLTATQLVETITPGTAEDYDFYTDETVYNCWGNAPETIFESSTGGNYTINLEATGDYEVTCVGGGGAAAMRGVYDDKGYGWGGGSGGAFKGIFELNAGSYTVVVGSANNNTTAQSGNTQTLNPTDTTTHDSYVQGVVTCGGGGSGHYNTSYVGAAGAAPVFSIMPESTTINSAGNAGSYNSGGKGSAAAAICAGGASVYLDYGRGQGCKTSEYAAKRSWINGTNGYVRIRRIYQ